MKSSSMPGREQQTASWRSLKNFPLPVKNVIEKMETGEISEVIEVPPLYMIVKLRKRQEGSVKNFSQVKEEIRGTLSRARYQSLLKEYLLKMKKTAKIKINESLLNNFTKKVKNGL